MPVKSTVIFVDQDLEENKPTNHVVQAQQKPKLMLSRDEYKDVVKEAYKEGVKDARSEKQQALSSPQETQKSDSPELTNKQEGEKEAEKTEAKAKEQTKQKVEAFTKKQEIELLRIKTMFPFTFFPDTLIIDATKITIIKKQFFATESVTTIPLKDVSDVTLQTVLFLASLTIQYMPRATSQGLTHPCLVSLNSIPRQSAIKAKNIIKGVSVARAEDIDISKLSEDEVAKMIEEFGQSEGVT